MAAVNGRCGAAVRRKRSSRTRPRIRGPKLPDRSLSGPSSLGLASLRSRFAGSSMAEWRRRRLPADFVEAGADAGAGAALFSGREVTAHAGFVDAVAGLAASDAELAGELGEGVEGSLAENDVTLGEVDELVVGDLSLWGSASVEAV